MSRTVALLLLTQISSQWGLRTDELPVLLPATSKAVLGGTALLNCTYPPAADLILYWTRLGPDSERNVYTYNRGEHLVSHEDLAYQGRTTVPAGQPGRGDGALRLHNVTLADEGRYRCRVKSNRGMGIAETELRLIGLYHLSWLQPQLCSPSLQNVTLTCLAEGGYPLATVTIHDSTGRDYGAGTRAAKDPQGLYSTAHTADVPCSPTASYTCTVNTTLHQQNLTGTLGLEEPQPAWKGWAGVGVGIGMGVAVVVLGSGALWVSTCPTPDSLPRHSGGPTRSPWPCLSFLQAGHQRRKGQRHQGPSPPREADPAREEALLEGTGPTCTRRGDLPDILQEPPPPSKHLTPHPSVTEPCPTPHPGPSSA
ncbi:butyrophilin-like protein 10 isoform X1 [Malaclemys terrapin pileata]|uniref:butyrophilin-like protein 10 isoform X1 n=1 Tax=Malaclemys terrapin pileata TaxID=2991368 RepID=UPI0023A83DD6|nr:butyrophilin-like protein 10 isoform X1 [Malaclemys terrapin pileata]XP_053882687.1 butyrophilin-like protein 10 isoform X1 [Malaclemys terrapin pileata]